MHWKHVQGEITGCMGSSEHFILAAVSSYLYCFVPGHFSVRGRGLIVRVSAGSAGYIAAGN